MAMQLDNIYALLEGDADAKCQDASSRECKAPLFKELKRQGKLAGYALDAVRGGSITPFGHITWGAAGFHSQRSGLAVICVSTRFYAHLAASRQYELCHGSDADDNVLVLRRFQALRHQLKHASYMQTCILASATQCTYRLLAPSLFEQFAVKLLSRREETSSACIGH